MLRLLLIFACVIVATSVFALDVPTPTGYTPWFSIDGTWVPGEITISQQTEVLLDWTAITVVAVASNAVGSSAPSDPSVETLIAPAGTTVPIQGWSGPVVVKQTGKPISCKFTQPAGGVPSNYSFFIKTRNPIGSCSKPGQVTVTP
jgi:hypothetical protein